MKLSKFKAHILLCAVTSFLSATLAFVAFYWNSWGIWQKSSAMSSCLPLPPPIGCSDQADTEEVLVETDTDFGWLSFLSCWVSFSVTVGLAMLLLGDDAVASKIETHSIKKAMLVACLVAATLNVLTCLIATFRISILSTLHRKQGLFVAHSLPAVHSGSFYLSVLASLFALLGCHLISIIDFDDIEGKQALSKTVKQHMARNLMFPDDQRSTKMITFSSMAPDMEEAAAEVCIKAVMQYGLEEDVAEHIKQAFEARYGPTWHCAVGANFGSALHHRTTEYIEVAMPQLSVLLFRCEEPKTEAVLGSTLTAKRPR